MKNIKNYYLALSLSVLSIYTPTTFAQSSGEDYPPSSTCDSGGDNIERCLEFNNFLAHDVITQVTFNDCTDGTFARFDQKTVPANNNHYRETFGQNGQYCSEGIMTVRFLLNGVTDIGSIDYTIHGYSRFIYYYSMIKATPHPAEGFYFDTEQLDDDEHHITLTNIYPH